MTSHKPTQGLRIETGLARARLAHAAAAKLHAAVCSLSAGLGSLLPSQAVEANANKPREKGSGQGDLAAAVPGPSLSHFPAAELSMTKSAIQERSLRTEEEEENKNSRREEACVFLAPEPRAASGRSEGHS